ncbi:hypothetical protein BJ741DRAFT_168437 [Chytriomyces cf. hyalinus JEL632]|nr:hypothetical protein BJ741DRAFT_168437 [Chytriomyces cf. hyalinus JEL632]
MQLNTLNDTPSTNAIPDTMLQNVKPSSSTEANHSKAKPASNLPHQKLTHTETSLKKKSGRKWTDNEASKRVMQNRAAQRLHRQRKQEHLQELEEKAKLLDQMVEGGKIGGDQVGGNDSPAVVQLLNTKIGQLEAENANLKQLVYTLMTKQQQQQQQPLYDGANLLTTLPTVAVAGLSSGLDFSLFDAASQFSNPSLLLPLFSPANSVQSLDEFDILF